MTGFTLVLALLVYAILSTANHFRRNVSLNLLIVTYLFIVASLVYFSFETYKGWPTTDKAEKGELISVYIVEPRGREPGAIYFWILPAEDEDTFIEDLYTYEPEAMHNPPRAHYTPYTKQKASKFRMAQEALESGMIVTMEDTSSSDGEASAEPGSAPPDTSTGESNKGDGEDYEVPHFKIEEPSQRMRKQ
jgi:hypothetical protein